MTKCETRKQLSYPTWYRHFPRKWWVKSPTCMTVVNSSVILTNGGGGGGGGAWGLLNVSSRENPVVKQCPESETQNHPV